MKNKLEVIQDSAPKGALLPNHKEHVSFSEMLDWVECSWRHKLKHIDRLGEFKPSVHTEYGQTIHDAFENYILQPPGNRTAPQPEVYIEEFRQLLIPVISDQETKIKELEGNPVAQEKEIKELQNILNLQKEMEEALPGTFAEFPDWFENTFPGWEALHAEFALHEEFMPSAKFKGFVDGIFKVPDKKSPTGYYIYIIDWKTSSRGWSAYQKKDTNRHLQLVLYKYFVCKKLNLDPNIVKTAFVIIRRNKPKSKDRFDLIEILSGKKKTENAVKKLTGFILQMKAGRYMKNKNTNTCRFCPFAYTEHCP